jgi:hypothetical protein
LLAAAAAVGLVWSPSASGQLVYSLDIGSDLDMSDPGGAGPADAGDLYDETFGLGTTIKNDTSGGPNVGFPEVAAPQPLPTAIGSVAGGASAVRSAYDEYFDLDGEDQLNLVIPELPTTPLLLEGLDRPTQESFGISFEPTTLLLSFEDDGPAGWAATGDVPTTALPDHGLPAPADEVVSITGPFTTWGPPVGVRDETTMGLPIDPFVTTQDDDVDALDDRVLPHWYWSADHEANLGNDPGGIYYTDPTAPGANKALVLDDVANVGIAADADVDAFEFVSISQGTFVALFGFDPDGGTLVGPDVLTMLFSVDANDPDNDITAAADDFHGDESGGLSPSVIYISNLVGTTVPLIGLEEDIDAITVPEPGTAAVMLLAAGLLARRRGRERE